jgi:hypothetical protein
MGRSRAREKQGEKGGSGHGRLSNGRQQARDPSTAAKKPPQT